MGQIITISSSKGGSGKTTLATLLAICLGSIRHPFAIIDADPNETLSDWLSVTYEGPPIGHQALASAEGVVDAANAAAELGDVIIDTAGFGSEAAATAIVASDAVLIPVMADRGSVREAMRTHDLVRRVHERMIPCKVVFSQWAPRNLAESATVEDINAAGLETLTTHIPDLAAFRQLSFTGRIPSGRPYEIGMQLVEELARLRITSRPKKRK